MLDLIEEHNQTHRDDEQTHESYLFVFIFQALEEIRNTPNKELNCMSLFFFASVGVNI